MAADGPLRCGRGREFRGRTRWLFVIAGAAFVGGTIVIEHLADYYIEAFDTDNLGYEFMTALEEALEMAGVVIFIHALLAHLALPGRAVLPLIGIAAMEAAEWAPDPRYAPSRPAGVPIAGSPAD